MYYHICPHCGCHLDPGERCDCAKAKKEAPPVRLVQGKRQPYITRQAGRQAR